jgi:tripartite ATP-independent transporter DctM subunit
MVLQATLILFGVFFVLLFAGVPISAGIGIASIVTALFSFSPDVFAITAAQRCFSGIDSFSLMALPFFMLGGNIMNKGGIAQRLVRLARLIVGWIPGYLASTNVLANMFFGAISGSSVAAASAMGSIMNPMEKEEGYDPNYSAAVNICSAPTGIIIPPSGPLILYSITAGGVSVAALFMGGYLPGTILGLCVMAVAIYIGYKKGYKASTVKEECSALKNHSGCYSPAVCYRFGNGWHPMWLVYTHRSWCRLCPLLHCACHLLSRDYVQGSLQHTCRYYD